MKLSIIAIICDKDADLFGSLLNSITNAKQPEYKYELLIMDNRTKKNPLPSANAEGNYQLIDMGGNYFQFEAKRRAAFIAKGEYIWFVDGDDEILSFPKNLKSDINCYNFTRDDGYMPLRYISKNKTINSNTNLLDFDLHSEIGTVMWCTVFKTEIVRKIAKQLPINVKVHTFEDFVWTTAIMYNSKSVTFNKMNLYQYNARFQDSARTEYSSIEPLKRWLTGGKEVLDIMDFLIPKDEQQKSGIRSIDVWRNHLLNCLEKLEGCVPEIKDEFVELIISTFGARYVTETILYAYAVDDPTKIKMLSYLFPCSIWLTR